MRSRYTEKLSQSATRRACRQTLAEALRAARPLWERADIMWNINTHTHTRYTELNSKMVHLQQRCIFLVLNHMNCNFSVHSVGTPPARSGPPSPVPGCSRPLSTEQPGFHAELNQISFCVFSLPLRSPRREKRVPTPRFNTAPCACSKPHGKSGAVQRSSSDILVNQALTLIPPRQQAAVSPCRV